MLGNNRDSSRAAPATGFADPGKSTPLFADEGDWRALPARLAADPVLRRIADATRERAREHLAAPLVVHVLEGTRRLASARRFLGRVLDLATVFRLDGDAAAAERACVELSAVLDLPDWGTHHFLDVGEYALGVAIGYDWLSDAIPSAERDRVERALIERALRPSFEADAFSLRWLGGTSNWTQVCHAGLVAAALAVAHRAPELAERTVARAIADQAGPASAYAPDGAYAEGPTYWTYGTTFEVVLISMLERARRSIHDLADAPGFLTSADYIAQMITPTGRFYNYGDTREVVPPMPVLHWFAARRGEPQLAEAELRRLETGARMSDAELRPEYERLDALALWWRATPKAETTCQGARTLPRRWLGRGENPVAVARTAWADPSAAFLGIKGGRATTSHAHLDAGSFVYESGGVRWALDLGMQDYHSLESAGVQLWDGSQDGERWRVFRLGPEAHNLLRFDRLVPDVNGMATVDETVEGGFEVNLTAVHAPELAVVIRQARLTDDGTLWLKDSWTAADGPTRARWQWLTEAEVELTANGALLRQDGLTLALRVHTPAAGDWSIAEEAVPSLLRPTDAPCPRVRRITITVPCAAHARGHIAVEARLV